MQITSTPESLVSPRPASTDPAASRRPVVALDAHHGEHHWFLDHLVTFKVGAREGSPCSVMEITLPAGSRSPFHRHDEEDEALFVLEGELTVFVDADARVVRARPGSYVYLPKGTAHGFRSETPVRMLVTAGPSGFVDLVREAGMIAPRAELPPATPPDVARLAAIAARHRITILGPLPEGGEESSS